MRKLIPGEFFENASRFQSTAFICRVESQKIAELHVHAQKRACTCGGFALGTRDLVPSPGLSEKSHALDSLAGYIVCGPGSHVFDWQASGMTLCFNSYSWVHS